MSLLGSVLRRVVERQARGRSLEDLQRQLEESGKKTSAHLAAAADTPKNRTLANHVVGIERWGHRRLRVALGEPPVQDEHDAYCPGPECDLPALRQAFETARAETLSTARAIARQPSPQPVPHNHLGPLSLGAWLVYLADHAARESSRLKPR